MINTDIESLKKTREELTRQIESFDKFKSLADGGLTTAIREFTVKITKLEKILDNNQELEDSVST